MDRNLFSQLDYLTRCADAVAPAARELERQQSLMRELQQPIAQLAAQKQAEMYRLAEVFRSPAEYHLASQASTLSSIAEQSRWMAEPRALDSWKQILVRWPRLPEVLYTISLPEVETSIYAAARPEIVNVAQQLRETYDFTSLQVFVGWPEAPHLAGLFELDLDHDLDLDAPLADGPVITVSPEAAPIKPGKLPDFVSPFDSSFDATVQRRPLGVKQLVVSVAGRPRLVRIVVKGMVAGGTGGLVGGIAGWYVGGPAEGMMGAWVGSAVSGAVSDSVSESIVVFIEKHSRD